MCIKGNRMYFFKVITGNIVKWWQLVVMPILKIDNNSNQNQQVQTEQLAASEQKSDPTQVVEQKVVETKEQPSQQETKKAVADTVPTSKEETKSETATTGGQQDAADALAVMERINREREAKRKADLEKAQEEARLASIMNSNKVDVDAFIQAGRESRVEKEAENKAENNIQITSGSDSKDDAIARAEEIMARLNREAAEDEAKKQAEIEAAKKQAEETFGV